MKIENVTNWKTTILGLLFIGLGVWKIFFSNGVGNNYEWAYYFSIIGGVLLVLSPDTLLNILIERFRNK